MEDSLYLLHSFICFLYLKVFIYLFVFGVITVKWSVWATFRSELDVRGNGSLHLQYDCVVVENKAKKSSWQTRRRGVLVFQPWPPSSFHCLLLSRNLSSVSELQLQNRMFEIITRCWSLTPPPHHTENHPQDRAGSKHLWGVCSFSQHFFQLTFFFQNETSLSEVSCLEISGGM